MSERRDDPRPDDALQTAARALARSARLAVFTGAGVSKESGIPTFRDPGGLWSRFDPDEFGTWTGLARLADLRPTALADFLAAIRRTFSRASPSPGHAALARLERQGVLRAVVTQNVDGLHQDAGSREVVEIHGSFRRTQCLRCGHRDDIGRAGLLGFLDRAVVGLRSAFVGGLESILARCSRCSGPARPAFVAFGELPHDMDRAEELARTSRAMLVVGTSGDVLPAAALPEMTRAAGGTVVVVSSGTTTIRADVRVEGPAGEVLPRLADAVVAARR